MVSAGTASAKLTEILFFRLIMQMEPSSSMGSNAESSLLKEFYIPTYVLVAESEAVSVTDFPQCPVLVFINSKSGGQLGGDLLLTYRSILNDHQVLITSHDPAISLSLFDF